MKPTILLILGYLALAMACVIPACKDSGDDDDSDSGADADADSDADGDADSDADGDTDADMDAGADSGSDSGAVSDSGTVTTGKLQVSAYLINTVLTISSAHKIYVIVYANYSNPNFSNILKQGESSTGDLELSFTTETTGYVVVYFDENGDGLTPATDRELYYGAPTTVTITPGETESLPQFEFDCG